MDSAPLEAPGGRLGQYRLLRRLDALGAHWRALDAADLPVELRRLDPGHPAQLACWVVLADLEVSHLPTVREVAADAAGAPVVILEGWREAMVGSAALQSVPALRDATAALLMALSRLHEHGIIHGPFTEQDLGLDAAGDPVLCGFHRPSVAALDAASDGAQWRATLALSRSGAARLDAAGLVELLLACAAHDSAMQSCLHAVLQATAAEEWDPAVLRNASHQISVLDDIVVLEHRADVTPGRDLAGRMQFGGNVVRLRPRNDLAPEVVVARLEAQPDIDGTRRYTADSATDQYASAVGVTTGSTGWRSRILAALLDRLPASVQRVVVRAQVRRGDGRPMLGARRGPVLFAALLAAAVTVLFWFGLDRTAGAADDAGRAGEHQNGAASAVDGLRSTGQPVFAEVLPRSADDPASADDRLASALRALPGLLLEQAPEWLPLLTEPSVVDDYGGMLLIQLGPATDHAVLLTTEPEGWRVRTLLRLGDTALG